MAWENITLPTDSYSDIADISKDYMQSQAGEYMETQDGALVETQNSISDTWTDID
jgi:hypothetical protein